MDWLTDSRERQERRRRCCNENSQGSTCTITSTSALVQCRRHGRGKISERMWSMFMQGQSNRSKPLYRHSETKHNNETRLSLARSRYDFTPNNFFRAQKNARIVCAQCGPVGRQRAWLFRSSTNKWLRKQYYDNLSMHACMMQPVQTHPECRIIYIRLVLTVWRKHDF
jgi:hypothetical protein